MHIDWALLAVVSVIFAFAGTIKGVIGVGLPTIGTGLLCAFMPPAQAASIVVLPALLTNVWQMWNGPDLAGLLKRLWPNLTLCVIGTLLTAGIITGRDVRPSVALLGVALMIYAAYALTTPRFVVSPRREGVVGAGCGLVNGLISGATGVFIMPTLPFLQSIEIGKNELVQAIGLTAFTGALGLMLGLGINGGLNTTSVVPTMAALAAAFAGMSFGQLIRDRLSLDTFRRWVLIGLFGLGCSMVARVLV